MSSDIGEIRNVAKLSSHPVFNLLFFSFEDLLSAFDWLLSYALVKSAGKTGDKNQAQVYYHRTLSIIYIQRTAIVRFAEFLDNPGPCQRVLEKLLVVFILKLFEQYSSMFYEGGYIRNGQVNQWFENRLIDLCDDLRREIVLLMDVFAPPDEILNSVLGNSDGRVYESIVKSIFENKKTFPTPNYLLEKSKL